LFQVRNQAKEGARLGTDQSSKKGGRGAERTHKTNWGPQRDQGGRPRSNEKNNKKEGQPGASSSKQGRKQKLNKLGLIRKKSFRN